MLAFQRSHQHTAGSFFWMKVSQVGGWATPLKNIKVSWDDYSQLYGQIKFMFQTTNQYIYNYIYISSLSLSLHHHISAWTAKIGLSDGFHGKFPLLKNGWLGVPLLPATGILWVIPTAVMALSAIKTYGAGTMVRRDYDLKMNWNDKYK